jgi:hypothetical protein
MVEAICEELHTLLGGLPRVAFQFAPSSLPKNGIYILFERGETGHGCDRIVRVGTHTGQDQLRSRLKQHFLVENKDRSIFRKNIGRALLAKANDPFAPQWEYDLTSIAGRAAHAHLVDAARKRLVEAQVSAYIQANFSFAVLPIAEKIDRLQLESRLISTVSACEKCHPSPSWLGNHSPKVKIRSSGLWLVNELYKAPLTRLEFEMLKRSCDPL